MKTVKIIKVPMGAYLDTKTTVFKIVELNNKEIINLDVGNMFYSKKRQAIKYINNSNEYQLEVEWELNGHMNIQLELEYILLKVILVLLY